MQEITKEVRAKFAEMNKKELIVKIKKDNKGLYNFINTCLLSGSYKGRRQIGKSDIEIYDSINAISIKVLQLPSQLNIAEFLMKERDKEDVKRIEKGKRKSMFDEYVSMIGEISKQIMKDEKKKKSKGD